MWNENCRDAGLPRDHIYEYDLNDDTNQAKTLFTTWLERSTAAAEDGFRWPGLYKQALELLETESLELLDVDEGEVDLRDRSKRLRDRIQGLYLQDAGQSAEKSYPNIAVSAWKKQVGVLKEQVKEGGQSAKDLVSAPTGLKARILLWIGKTILLLVKKVFGLPSSAKDDPGPPEDIIAGNQHFQVSDLIKANAIAIIAFETAGKGPPGIPQGR